MDFLSSPNLQRSFGVALRKQTKLSTWAVCLCSVARLNEYDGVEEFYVRVEETGQREEEEAQEETRRKRSHLEACGAWGIVVVQKTCDKFHRI